jgi:hypothetical protein
MMLFLKRNFLQLTIGLTLFTIATESCWHKSCEQVCIER